MAVKARLRCNSSFKYSADSQGRQVNLSAVYSNDPNDPNFSYSQATPSANLQMAINNPDAEDFFEPGATYDLTFTKVEKD